MRLGFPASSQYRRLNNIVDELGKDERIAALYDLWYTVAKYMLGKLYLRGEDVPKQLLHALHWLESAVQDDNQYAEYLFGKVLLKGDDVERDTE